MSERDEDVLAEELEALREQHASTPQAAEREHAPVPVPNGKRVTLGMYVAEYTVRNGWSWWEDTPTHYEHSTGWGILHTALDRIHALEAELVKLRAEVARLQGELSAKDYGTAQEAVERGSWVSADFHLRQLNALRPNTGTPGGDDGKA